MQDAIEQHTPLSRRAALGLFGGAVGAALMVGCGGGSGEDDSSSSSSGTTTGSTTSTTTTCAETVAKTEGPYWVDEKLNRSDIRTDTEGAAGTQSGVPLTLTFYVDDASSSSCTPLEGIYVDIWHANALGLYSDEANQPGGSNTTGQNFLRGYQVSDADGKVSFTTIYPGWYSGRAPHIHVRFRKYDASGNVSYDDTTQVFFDPSITTTVYADNAPYNTRAQVQADTSNATDTIYAASLLLSLSGSGSAYAGTYTFGYPLDD